jgi:uncharacterized protein YndB with AHSA1/START domain
MWRSVRIEESIPHPPAEVFAYLASPTLWPQFAPAVVRRTQLDDEPPTVGTRWAATDRIGPFRFDFTDELVEWEHGRRVVWFSSSPWNARVEYVCHPESWGTRVVARYGGDMAGWLRLLHLVPPVVMARILAQDFRRLTRVLDRSREEARPALRPAGCSGSGGTGSRGRSEP